MLVMEVIKSCLQGKHRACDGGDEVLSTGTTSCGDGGDEVCVCRDNIVPVMEMMRSCLQGLYRACDGGDEVVSAGTTSCL